MGLHCAHCWRRVDEIAPYIRVYMEFDIFHIYIEINIIDIYINIDIFVTISECI